jgi:hypothetical protein
MRLSGVECPYTPGQLWTEDAFHCCRTCCSTKSGTIADAVAALWYLLDMKNRYDLNLVATQNSWGGGGFSQVRSEYESNPANYDVTLCGLVHLCC